MRRSYRTCATCWTPSPSAQTSSSCVEDGEAAERERFLGSPTVRVDGEDTEPGAGARTDFGLKRRLFATPEGLRGMPADEWVIAALAQEHTPAP